MPPKRLVPPSSDDEKDEHHDDLDSDDEEVSTEDEAQPTPQPIKIQKPKTQLHSESESDDEEDDEEEEVEEGHETPIPKKPTVSKPLLPSDSDSGSGSDSDLGTTSKHSPTASDFAVKPIATKPMADLMAPTADLSKPKKATNSKPSSTTAAAAAAPVVKPSAKRAIEPAENGSKSKKKKVSNGDTDGEEKKHTVNCSRLWSEEDEIVILKGMAEYWSKKGIDPFADVTNFHEFIKDSVRPGISKSQLGDKIRRLKKKYQVNVEKNGNGDDAVFSRPHEKIAFNLSKKLWGGPNSVSGIDDSAKSNNGQARRNGSKLKAKDEGKAIVVVEKPKDKEVIKVPSGDFTKMYPYLNSALEVQWETEPFSSLSEEDRRLMKEKLGRNSKVREVNDELKMLKLKELELYSKKLELMQEMTGMFLGALKSNE